VRPLRLRARNLRTFPELDLEFRDGLIGILGELRDSPEGSSSNGAGKSTLLEAIDIALFGRRSLAGYLTRGGDVDELMVELTFEHGGETYRVRRTFSAKGRGKTSVDLERSDSIAMDGSWEPLTRASAKETDEFLVELIGLSKETFRDSAYLRQGDGGYADPGRDPRQRKQLLVEAVLGRDPVWPRLAELAKGRRKLAEQQLERVHGEAESLRVLAGGATAAEYEARQADEQVVAAAANLSTAEQRLAGIAERYQVARDRAAARQALEAELREATAAVTTLQERESLAEQATLGLAAIRAQIDALAAEEAAGLEERVRELEAAIAAHQEAVREHDTALQEQARREADRAELRRLAGVAQQSALDAAAKAGVLERAPEPHCQTCGQPVAGEARDRAIAVFLAEKSGHEATAAKDLEQAAAIVDVVLPAVPEGEAPVDELRAVQARLSAAREARTERARLEERTRRFEQTIQARPTIDSIQSAAAAAAGKQQQLAELEPVDLAVLEQEGKAARVAVETARTGRETAIAFKARCDERVSQIRAAEAKLATLAGQVDVLQAQIDRDVLLERAYGRDGIPALILENTAIPSIEAEASRILRALGTSMDVQLRTQTETKTGGLRDTLEVVVIKDGCECEYETGLSEGEKTRVALALRIGLARLLRHRAGGSEMLALDEPSYLDAAGMAALLDVLREIEASGEFSLVFLVSHVAELRDSLEQTITVVQEHGVSRIAGAPVREAIAA
jgi:DNA repair protein SbcC/Rad50